MKQTNFLGDTNHQIPHKENNHLNRPTATKRIEPIIKKPPKKKAADPGGITNESYKTFKEKNNTHSLQYLRGNRKRGSATQLILGGQRYPILTSRSSFSYLEAKGWLDSSLLISHLSGTGGGAGVGWMLVLRTYLTVLQLLIAMLCLLEALTSSRIWRRISIHFYIVSRMY